MSPVSAVALAILTLFFLAVGGAALWAAADLTSDGRDSEAWPAIQGRIITSTVNVRSDLGGSRTGARGGLEFRPVVRYTYEVDGTVYTSDRVRFGERLAERGDGALDRVQARLDRYPVGRIVKVHVDPDDPDAAVLEPGRQSAPWLLVVGALALAVGGGFARVLGRYGALVFRERKAA